LDEEGLDPYPRKDDSNPYAKTEPYSYLDHFFESYLQLKETKQSYDFYYVNLINMTQVLLIFKYGDQSLMRFQRTMWDKIKFTELICAILKALHSCKVVDVYIVYILFLKYITLLDPANVSNRVKLNIGNNNNILNIYTFNHFKPYIYGRAEACKLFITNINPFTSVHGNLFETTHNKIIHNYTHRILLRKKSLNNNNIYEYKDILKKFDSDIYKKIFVSFIHFVYHENMLLTSFSKNNFFKSSRRIIVDRKKYDFFIYEFLIDIANILNIKYENKIDLYKNTDIFNYFTTFFLKLIEIYKDNYPILRFFEKIEKELKSDITTISNTLRINSFNNEINITPSYTFANYISNIYNQKTLNNILRNEQLVPNEKLIKELKKICISKIKKYINEIPFDDITVSDKEIKDYFINKIYYKGNNYNQFKNNLQQKLNNILILPRRIIFVKNIIKKIKMMDEL
jgi:hypothetical protein